MIYNVAEGCPHAGRKFFFDTNVWLAIFGPDIRSDRRVYSNFYKSILDAGSEVVVSDCILSEFFNRAGKIEYEIAYEDRDYTKYKSRRVEAEFVSRMESVRDTCLDIIDYSAACVSSHFEDALQTCLSIAASGRLDYTDALIVNLCKKNGYILVTHDYDFEYCSIDIATANKRYLQKK